MNLPSTLPVSSYAFDELQGDKIIVDKVKKSQAADRYSKKIHSKSHISGGLVLITVELTNWG